MLYKRNYIAVLRFCLSLADKVCVERRNCTIFFRRIDGVKDSVELFVMKGGGHG